MNFFHFSFTPHKTAALLILLTFSVNLILPSYAEPRNQVRYLLQVSPEQHDQIVKTFKKIVSRLERRSLKGQQQFYTKMEKLLNRLEGRISGMSEIEIKNSISVTMKSAGLTGIDRVRSSQDQSEVNQVLEVLDPPELKNKDEVIATVSPTVEIEGSAAVENAIENAIASISSLNGESTKQFFVNMVSLGKQQVSKAQENYSAKSTKLDRAPAQILAFYLVFFVIPVLIILTILAFIFLPLATVLISLGCLAGAFAIVLFVINCVIDETQICFYWLYPHPIRLFHSR